MNGHETTRATPSIPTAPDETSVPGFERAARLAVWGLTGLGLIAGARIVAGNGAVAVVATDSAIVHVLGAVYVAVAHGLVGVGLGALIRGMGSWLRSRTLRDAAFRNSLADLSASLESLATSLPASHASPDSRHPSAGAAELAREKSAADVRQAIRAGDWNTAANLLDALSRDHAGDSQVSTLAAEHQAAREAVMRDWTAQLDAARKVNDPERVLDLHQAMLPLLDHEARASLESDLSQWFLRLIHKRLRTGKIQADVAVLAGRIADAFSHTVEGASLRASLPTLRRSAGLCPRCSQPYTGVADSCPSCLAATRLPAPSPTPPEPTTS
jgi:hypothetical protein